MERMRAGLAMIACATLVGCSPTDPSDFLEARLSLDEHVVTSGQSSVGRVEVPTADRTGSRSKS
jgi:hypothetical protein